jgi:site-specific recombinase XerD
VETPKLRYRSFVSSALLSPIRQFPLSHRHGDFSGVGDDDALVLLWIANRGGRSLHTRRAYQTDARTLLIYLRQRGLCLHSMKLRDLQEWADDVAGAAPTRKRRMSTVKGLLSFATQTGYLPINVGAALQVPKVSNGLAERILSEEQIFALLGAASSLRDRVLVRCAYATGARASEIAALRWVHLNHHANEMVITLHGKGGRSRHVRVAGKLIDELRELRGGAGDQRPVFLNRSGAGLSARGIHRIVAKLAKSAGIKRSVGPHFLRHSHASHALDRGAPAHLVQQTLGHADLSVTSRYCHVRPGTSSGLFLAV